MLIILTSYWWLATYSGPSEDVETLRYGYLYEEITSHTYLHL